MSRKKITIGLFGFGCVGHGLFEVLQKTPTLKANIKRICVKDKNKDRQIARENFTYDKNDLLDDDEINVIVELIDDADAAFEITKAALKKGKAVVSANKKMIAEHFEELLNLQREYNVPLLYEAACCASIPIIRNLEEYYDNDLLESIEGIVNGSTNYILTRITEEKSDYKSALLDAQRNGFAESDPTLDTSGLDAKYKLQILLAHAFGIVVKPNEIFNLGIDRIGKLELDYAREKGYKIKLVAHAEKTGNGKILSLVIPKFVRSNEKLFGVNDVFNGILTKTQFSDTQFFVGKGAGAYPTASAVLSDISALSYDYRYEYKKLNAKETLEKDESIILRVFLRHEIDYGEEFKRKFEDLDETYLNHQYGFIIGTISLKNLAEIAKRNHSNASFVLFEILNENNEIANSKKRIQEYELSD